jgi:hypothetical protein
MSVDYPLRGQQGVTARWQNCASLNRQSAVRNFLTHVVQVPSHDLPRSRRLVGCYRSDKIPMLPERVQPLVPHFEPGH